MRFSDSKSGRFSLLSCCCLVGLFPLLTLLGCGGEDGPPRKDTFKLTGQVLIDGKPPNAPVKVTCHNVAGLDKEQPTLSSTLTDDEGNFEVSTYESGDGVPAGDYVLTFRWGKMDLISRSYGGKDKLKGKYSDPEKSPFQVTVQPGEPTDLGKIELSTK